MANVQYSQASTYPLYVDRSKFRFLRKRTPSTSQSLLKHSLQEMASLYDANPLKYTSYPILLRRSCPGFFFVAKWSQSETQLILLV